MSDFDHLTERQQIALRFLGIVEDKRIHEVRRDALRDYADPGAHGPEHRGGHSSMPAVPPQARCLPSGDEHSEHSMTGAHHNTTGAP